MKGREEEVEAERRGGRGKERRDKVKEEGRNE